MVGLMAGLAGSVQAHGDLHERIEQFLAVSNRQPDDPALHFELASLYRQHGDWQNAIQQLDEVDRLAPGKYLTDFLRGETLLDGLQYTPARTVLDTFLRAHPGHTRGLALRARALRALNESEACLADYRAALRGTPQPEPDLVMETADALAAYDRLDEAIQVLDTASAQQGAIVSLPLRAIELETNAGRFEAALQRVAAQQKLAARPESWLARRAQILAQAGRTTEAREAWQALLTHLGTLPDAQRHSHAMSRFAEQAYQGIAALHSSSSPILPLASSKP